MGVIEGLYVSIKVFSRHQRINHGKGETLVESLKIKDTKKRSKWNNRGCLSVYYFDNNVNFGTYKGS